MSPWDQWGWYRKTPKKPPPKRGIKMKKSGTTWWGQRWVEALERMSYGYSNRLARGRTYARAGRTHDLVIEHGKATAKVTGSRSRPYKVTIGLARLSDAVWDQAIAAMAAKAQFSAELLAGQMPLEIDAAFQAARASVFPIKEADLTTNCSCPDWANPCKHVAATHYVLGEAFDRDPFLLFELRGRCKAQVLDALRAARADESGRTFAKHGNGAEASEPVPSVTLGRIKAADWDKPPDSSPALRLSFAAPPVSGGVLRHLGAPTGWSSDTSPADLLGPMIQAAAERARAMAMAEATTDQQSAPEPVAASGRDKTRATSNRPRNSASARRGAATRASSSSSVSRTFATKKTATKKTATKKTAAKKATANKTAIKKATTKKATTKKTAAKKATKSGGPRTRR
jgi:uncharacterized Zn finger protein